MSKTKVSEKIIYTLWGRAGGVCEMCGNPLTIDSLTKRLWSRGYIAHIYGERPKAARYDKVLSKKYCNDINYLMLLCDSCHRLIDKEEKDSYDAPLLIKIKKQHEERVADLIQAVKKEETLAITLRLKIGEHIPPIFDNNMLIEAIVKNGKCPKFSNVVELTSSGIGLDDASTLYWQYYKEELSKSFKQLLSLYSNVPHLSLFAIAPQPILIFIGTLLSELQNVDVYQKHRLGNTWIWPTNTDRIKFKVLKPKNTNLDNVAIKFSLSADITDRRVTEVLGESTSIWEIRIDNPNVNFVKNSTIQADFKEKLGKILNDINRIRSDVDEINLFPAVPQSIAICIGQKRMPKADKKFVIYDQNNKEGKFIKTITIE